MIKGNNMKKQQLWIDLSDEQAEKVVGGSGRDLGNPGAGAGTNAWGSGTPFNPSGNPNAGLFKNFTPGMNANSAVNVFVPVKR